MTKAGKYIDRAALFNSLANAKTIGEVFAAIQDAPAEDVEKVVRCKDCKHADLFYPYCTIWEAAIDGDGYCYKGEKE